MGLLSDIFHFILPQKIDPAAIKDLADNFEALDGYLGETPVTVNNTPVTEGTRNIDLSTVPLAENLTSDQTQLNSGTYVIRSTGGGASVEDGEATLMSISGNMVHSGVIEESIEMTVTPIDPSASDAITAVIDRDAWIAAATGSGTTTFTFTNAWVPTPESYGITVSGTPAAGDQIVVEYVAENRGTIALPTPTAFGSTGWNLYDSANGYARVPNYSETYGFFIGGSYVSVEFSETLTGSRQSLTPVSGHFTVPGDGYVFVTGGDATTYIYMTWSDWTEGYDGEFEAYTADIIDISAVMVNFPFGLAAIGSVHDEINFSTQVATSRIARVAYSAEALETVIAGGTSYEADTSWIYYVRQSPVTYSFNLGSSYAVDDHGTEFLNGTQVPCLVTCIYGNNLKNKLEKDVLTKSAQALTAAEQAQVESNLGIDLQELSTTIGGAVSAGLISNVNSKIATGGTLRLWKAGHVLELSMMPQATAAMQDGDVIFRLAKAVRPIMAVYEPLLNESYRVYQSKGISVSASTGDVSLRLNADLAAGYFRAHMVFMIQ